MTYLQSIAPNIGTVWSAVAAQVDKAQLEQDHRMYAPEKFHVLVFFVSLMATIRRQCSARQLLGLVDDRAITVLATCISLLQALHKRSYPTISRMRFV